MITAPRVQQSLIPYRREGDNKGTLDSNQIHLTFGR